MWHCLSWNSKRWSSSWLENRQETGDFIKCFNIYFTECISRKMLTLIGDLSLLSLDCKTVVFFANASAFLRVHLLSFWPFGMLMTKIFQPYVLQMEALSHQTFPYISCPSNRNRLFTRIAFHSSTPKKQYRWKYQFFYRFVTYSA